MEKWNQLSRRGKWTLGLVVVLALVYVACQGSSDTSTPQSPVPSVDQRPPDVVRLDATMVEPTEIEITQVEPTEIPPTDTPEPEPITLTGAGQTATDPVTVPWDISRAVFTHDGRRNFIVKAYYGSDEELLVNTIGVYQGAHPLVGGGVFFDIDADGAWTATIEPLGEASTALFSGTGDAVSGVFEPPDSGPWTVSHDGERNFVVKLYCDGDADLIQNEIGPVSGSTVIQFGRGPCFWEVQADGNWSLASR